MTCTSTVIDLRSPRAWVSLAFLVGAYFLFDPLENFVHQPIAHALHLRMIANGVMGLAPYTVLMVVRVVIDLAIVIGVCAILRNPVRGFPLVGANMTRNTLLGIGIGLVVMIAAISAIWLSGNARVVPSVQPIDSMILHGAGWFLADFLGATGRNCSVASPSCWSPSGLSGGAVRSSFPA